MKYLGRDMKTVVKGKCPASLEDARQAAPGDAKYIHDGAYIYFAKAGQISFWFRPDFTMGSPNKLDRTLYRYELARIRDPGIFEDTYVRNLIKILYWWRWIWRHRLWKG